MLRYLCICLLSMFYLSAVVEAADNVLRSHHALYEMKQIHKDNGEQSPISRVDGFLRYEFKNTCDGWDINYSTLLDLELINGQTMKKSLYYKSQESADGTIFLFKTSSKDNEVVSGQSNGLVQIVNGKKTATYAEAKSQPIILPEDVVFPTRNLIQLLNSAQKGGTNFNASYFDGTGPGSDLNVSVIPNRRTLDEGNKFNFPPMPTWNMKMSFSPLKSNNTKPEVEIIGRYRLDGVLTHILQDFGVFALKGQMVEFNYITEPKCN